MFMTLLSAVLGAATAVLVTAQCGLFSGIKDIWIPLLLFIGFTVLAAALIILTLFIATLFVNKKKEQEKPDKVWFCLYNIVNSFLCFWSGMSVERTENEKLGDGPYFFVTNHRSNFDTMLISMYYKKYKPLMVSKPGNFNIPIAGPAIHKAGFLCMPKDDPRKSLTVVNKASEYLKEGEYSIGLCPEGTRNKDGIDLLPFKNGCFKMATKANAPIVVICINGTEKVHKNFPFKRTKVYFDLIKVIKPDEYQGKTTTEIGDEIRRLMLENINSHQTSKN